MKSSFEVTTIERLSIFAGLSHKNLLKIAGCCELITVKPGFLLKESSRPWNCFYHIVSGKVQILNQAISGRRRAEILSDGKSIGESCFYSQEASQESAKVLDTATSLLKLSLEQLETLVAANNDLFKAVNLNSMALMLRSELCKRSCFISSMEPHLHHLAKQIKVQDFLAEQKIESLENLDQVLILILSGQLKTSETDSGSPDYHSVRGDILEGNSEVQSLIFDGKKGGRLGTLPREVLENFISSPSLFEKGLSSGAVQPEPTGLNFSPPAKLNYGPKSLPSDLFSEEGFSPLLEPKIKLPIAVKLGFYPCVRQQSIMDCGSACLQTLALYYGKKISSSYSRSLCRVSSTGTTLAHLKVAVQELGFQSVARRSTFDELRQATHPFIVNWLGYHWILVFKVNSEQLVVADPARGTLTLDRETFLENWSGYTLFLRPTEKVLEIRETQSPFKRYADFPKALALELMEVLLASVSMQILALALPLFACFTVNQVFLLSQHQWVFPLLLTLVVMVGLNALLTHIRFRLLSYITSRVKLLLFGDLLRHILRLPLKFFETRKLQDITGRLVDIDEVATFFAQDGARILLDALTATFYIGLLFLFHTGLATLSCLLILTNVLLIVFFSLRLSQCYNTVFEAEGELDQASGEALCNLTTIKTLGLEYLIRWKWEDLQIRYQNSYFQALKASIGGFLASGGIHQIMHLLILCYGSYLVILGELSLGGLVACVLISAGLTSPIMALVSSREKFQKAQHKLEKITEIFESECEFRPEDQNDKIQLPGLKGHIQIEEVCFRFDPDARENTLENLNFQIQPGQNIALVGKTGSGKSTLARLIHGYETPHSGIIFVDGFDLRDLWIPSLRKQIALVPQDAQVFQGTIRENLSMLRPGTSLMELIEMSQLMRAHEFIHSLPEGYDTVIKDRDPRLSRAEVQLITLVRAVLIKPSILILDEALFALRQDEAISICDTLRFYFPKTSFLMITSNPMLVRDFEQILLIDRGQIYEQGTHQDLMHQQGRYANLFGTHADLG
jgi:ABC-type bacteriocin/lantibiotic exporter with double-glycine peptidase domain